MAAQIVGLAAGRGGTPLPMDSCREGPLVVFTPRPALGVMAPPTLPLAARRGGTPSRFHAGATLGVMAPPNLPLASRRGGTMSTRGAAPPDLPLASRPGGIPSRREGRETSGRGPAWGLGGGRRHGSA